MSILLKPGSNFIKYSIIIFISVLCLFNIPFANAQNNSFSGAENKDSFKVNISDPDDVLSNNDEKSLVKQTENISFPEKSYVTDVNYIILDENSENSLDNKNNFNDSILEWIGKNDSRLVPDGVDKGDTWKDGSLIITVGLSSRGNGIYCGDDVCSSLDLFEGSHLDKSLDNMKPGLRKGNYVVGLFEGAKTAADPSQVMSNKSFGGTGWITITFFFLFLPFVIVVGIVLFFYNNSRKTKIKTAKENYRMISENYSETALKLDEIDIVANSLTSPLANDLLRQQWNDCKNSFLNVDKKFNELNISESSSNKIFYKNRKVIEEVKVDVEHFNNAKNNIEMISSMERGDSKVRKSELRKNVKNFTKLSAVVESLYEEKNFRSSNLKELCKRADDLLEKTRSLQKNLDNENFMNVFAEIVQEYGEIVEELQIYSDTGLSYKKNDERTVSSIYDKNYNIGSSLNNYFIPVSVMSSWNYDDNYSRHNSFSTNSSSSTITSFSSGFSGGGGSSSW